MTTRPRRPAGSLIPSEYADDKDDEDKDTHFQSKGGSESVAKQHNNDQQKR
jgi:hypothetical protein